MILAVDTSLGTTVALVGDDGKVLAQASSQDALGHAEIIGNLISQVLVQVPGGRVSAVVTGMGPGPFTGLRIGIATARAFAFGLSLPTIAVPSHQAVAWAQTRAGADGADGAPFAVVTDARRKELAVTVFAGLDDDGIPRVITDTVLVPATSLAGHIAGVRQVTAQSLSAADLGQVAIQAQRAGRRLMDGTEPLYLRQPDVAQPSATKLIATKPGATQPSVIQSGATQSGTAVPA